jgi:hypothetical protein
LTPRFGKGAARTTPSNNSKKLAIIQRRLTIHN